MTKAFPLQWPKGRGKTKRRSDSRFQVKPTKAFDEMMTELDRFGAANVVVSSNIPLRRDGTPYRDGLTELLQSPGVAVYFTKKKRQICLPCDAYRRPWENCRAIGKAVEAFRAIERHGADQILDQAFEGFTALPAPDQVSDSNQAAWWVVLGVKAGATKEQINEAYKSAARKAGGASVELNAAKEQGLAAVGEI